MRFLARDNIEFAVKIWRQLHGNALRRAALYLMVAAVAVQSNILQLAFSAIAAQRGLQITIPETSPWLSLAFAIIGFALLVVDRVRPEQPRIGPWQLEFPAKANLDSVQSLFVRAWTVYPSGAPIERTVSFVRLYLAVDNPADSKTLRNVRVVVDSISKPDQVVDIPLFSDGNRTDRIDIAPGATEYFLLGEGCDETIRGHFAPRFVSPEEYRKILLDVDRDKHVGFKLLSARGTALSLLRNDGIRIHVSAYADDTPSLTKLFVLNTRSRIELICEDVKKTASNR